jgi:glycosyltransferase involved in cell wall biosynthesis
MSPFESADVAAHLSRQFSIPWIADLRDPWALREVEIYPSFLHRLIELRKMHSRLSTASAIIMNTPEARESLKRNFPDLTKKLITVITNGFDPGDFLDLVPSGNNGKFRLVYTGTFYTDAGLAQLRKKGLYRILGGVYNESNLLTRSPFFFLRALKAWIRQEPRIRNNIEVIFAGVPTDKDYSLIRESGLSDIIHFTGYIPHNETIRLIMSANNLFICMHDVGKNKRSTTVGGKDYEYMASGRPILAAVPEGDAKDFLRQCGTAFICAPDDCQEMARILARVYKAWERGDSIVSPNKEFLNQFERRNLTKSLAAVFDRVLNGLN